MGGVVDGDNRCAELVRERWVGGSAEDEELVRAMGGEGGDESSADAAGSAGDSYDGHCKKKEKDKRRSRRGGSVWKH